MSDVITSKKPSRLDAIESLPAEIRDNALIDWQTFADIFDRKDVANTRKWAMSLGLPLVNLGRRKLPRWKDVRALIEARKFIPESLTNTPPRVAGPKNFGRRRSQRQPGRRDIMPINTPSSDAEQQAGSTLVDGCAA
jgi:hypothetical protein